MQWWVILILVIIVLLILAALHPIRVRIEGSIVDNLNVSVILKPFGVFPGSFKLIDIKNKSLNDLNEKKTDKNNMKRKKKLRPSFFKKKKVTKNKDENIDSVSKLPIEKSDVVSLLDDCLSVLRIEDLDLEANLSGDPYHSGVACGFLWTFFGGGFAFISHRVKKFTKKPIMNFGVDLERPWSAYLKLQIMVRVGDIVKIVIKLFAVYLRTRKTNPKTIRTVQ